MADGVTLLRTGEGSRGVKVYLFPSALVTVQGVVATSACHYSQHLGSYWEQSKWKQKPCFRLSRKNHSIYVFGFGKYFCP